MNILTSLLVLMAAIAVILPQQVIGFKPKDKSIKKAALADAKLVMTLNADDGGILTRTTRGSENPAGTIGSEAKTETVEEKTKGSGSDKQRSKHGGGGGAGSRKFNRNQDFNHAVAGGNGRKSHGEKKPANSGEQQQHLGKRQQASLNRQQQRQQQQLLKSQQHQQQEQHPESKRKSQQKQHDEQELIGGNSKSQSTCRYTKSPWSECDRKSNTHSRTLTLKKGDTNCLPTRTIQKKCKKSCRYDKGAWSECKDGEMTRVDNLKMSTSASSANPANSNCEPTRTINRKCNPERNSRKSSKAQHNNNGGKSNKKERKNKDKETKHQPA